MRKQSSPERMDPGRQQQTRSSVRRKLIAFSVVAESALIACGAAAGAGYAAMFLGTIALTGIVCVLGFRNEMKPGGVFAEPERQPRRTNQQPPRSTNQEPKQPDLTW